MCYYHKIVYVTSLIIIKQQQYLELLVIPQYLYILSLLYQRTVLFVLKQCTQNTEYTILLTVDGFKLCIIYTTVYNE